MLQNEDFDEMIEPIVQIYNKIEMELLLDVAQRFSTYSSIDGSLEWYLSKLNDMNMLNNNAVKIFAKYSGVSEEKIRNMLEKAQFGNFIKSDIDKAYDQGLSKVTYDSLVKNKLFKDTLESSYKELDKSFRLIQTKAIESQKQAYMDILNKAYIDVASGTYSYNQSIRKGIENMAKKGITGVSYKRKDGTIINYSIEAAVRRDTLTATHKLANEVTFNAVKELGTNYVDVSQHLGARVSNTNPIADHAGWQGKQYQLEGESKEYSNFAKSTGYGDILGFGGVNCRHRAFAFFPGISVPLSQQIDYQENKEVYENNQQLRNLERDMRSLKKQKNCFKEINAVDKVEELNNKINAKSEQIDRFCDDHNLKRDYSREQVI